ncbi:MAG: four helix bundle protein [Vicinamibacteria bacterium]
MNANPAFAASVAPALQSTVVRAPERARGVVTTLETFDVYRVSLDACRACAPIAPSLSATLRDQLLRASSSAVLNTAEGFGSASRGVKRRHYEIARGSAMECVAILDIAVALGLQNDVAASRALFTRAAMMLSRLEARFR